MLIVATQVDASGLVKDSWDFFSKNIGKLWQVALLLAAPGVISALMSEPKTVTQQDLESISDISSYSETVFGVSLATVGFVVLVWLVISVLYSAIVYGGAVGTMIKALRGGHGDISFSGVFNEGTKTMGSIILLGIVAGLIIGVGFILLIIPGLIAAFLLSFSAHYLVDKGKGVGASMSASYNTVKDNVGSVFMVWLIVFAISFVLSLVFSGIFGPGSGKFMQAIGALGTGFVTTFTLVAATKLYLVLSGHSQSAATSEE